MNTDTMTQIHIALPESLRQYVDEQVASGGYDTASEYVQELIRAEQERQAAGAAEAELMRRVLHSFPERMRQRLHDLTRRSEAETLSGEERAEYITLAEQREQADAERWEAVGKLARLRGVSVAQLMTELGLGATGHV
jgi:putative addiction module CopG family antidote